MAESSRQNMGKRKAEDPSATISLMVKSQDGREVFFKIKRTTKLKKLLTSFCDRRFMEFDQTRFLIDGNFFNVNETPDELGLADGCQIDAMVEQLGGGYVFII